MNSAELLKHISIERGEFSDSPKGAICPSAIGQVFKQTFTPIELTLRYYQRSLCELSVLTEGYHLRIENNRLVVINNYIEKEKRRMQMGYIDELKIPVDISLGQVELSVADLLALERGESIISKLSPLTKVSLLIAGENIAEASFEVEDDTILLKINEVFLKKADEASDNQNVINN